MFGIRKWRVGIWMGIESRVYGRRLREASCFWVGKLEGCEEWSGIVEGRIGLMVMLDMWGRGVLAIIEISRERPPGWKRASGGRWTGDSMQGL